MEHATTPQWKYLIMWEFRVRPGMEKEFEAIYGPNGRWARFFASGEGYVGTELNRDLKGNLRYVTLDMWSSRQAYEQFRAQHLEEYAAIDAECELMTVSEVEIGTFERIA